MELIENLRRRVAQFNEGLTSGQYFQEIISNNEGEIVAMNADEQLYEEGINAVGISIMDYAPYAPSTIKRKIAKGQPYNRVTLRDEGDFEASFFIEADRQKFEIKASDWKAEYLTRRYGSQILGLTEENVARLTREIVYPEIRNIANNYLYGKSSN